MLVDGTRVASFSSSPAIWSWDTTSAANASHTLQARAHDAAGNVGTSAVVTVTVNNTVQDTTAPVAQVSSPAAGATVSGTVSVEPQATDDVGVTRLELLLDSTVVATFTSGTGTWSWDTTKAANGTHTLQARAYDAAGNRGDSSLMNVTVSNTVADTTPPTVQINSPVAGATVSGAVSVKPQATDDVGVTRLELLLDSTVVATFTSGTGTWSWDTTKAANGTHTLQARAYDAAGNRGDSTPMNVTVSNTVADTTVPTVQINSPVTGTTVSGNVSVTASASDNVGVTAVKLYVDGKLAGTVTGGSAVFTWNTAGLKGQHTLQAKATDAAGNTGVSASVQVTVGKSSVR